MKPSIIARTRTLLGEELLGALEQLQGVSASCVLHVCCYTLRNGNGQRRMRPRAFERTLVQSRGAESGIDNRSVATVVC
jgi:hypothetical protein